MHAVGHIYMCNRRAKHMQEFADMQCEVDRKYIFGYRSDRKLPFSEEMINNVERTLHIANYRFHGI